MFPLTPILRFNIKAADACFLISLNCLLCAIPRLAACNAVTALPIDTKRRLVNAARRRLSIVLVAVFKRCKSLLANLPRKDLCNKCVALHIFLKLRRTNQAFTLD